MEDISTIASEYEELVFFCDLVARNIGVGGYYLGLRSQCVILFEFKVAQSP